MRTNKRLRHGPLAADLTEHDPERQQIAEVAARIADEAVAAFCEHESSGLDLIQRSTQMSVLLRTWVDAIEEVYNQWQRERDRAALDD